MGYFARTASADPRVTVRMPESSYRYGVVYVHACFTGYQAWHRLASRDGDLYYSGPGATTAAAAPTTAHPPSK
jgi:hypothetical protein